MKQPLPLKSTVPSKILLVDDDENLRQILVKFLRKEGYEIQVAFDGKEGVALAAASLPDLILCDLMMPEMNGYELLAALRLDPKLADIPLIFLTGQSEPSQIRQGMNLGADDYLTKPVGIADLKGAIQARLDRRQQERQRQEKQIDRATQQFAGIIHDLRDPLFAVLCCNDRLKRVPGQGGDASSGEILDRMQQAIFRMQTIITDTMFLARSRMQRLPFDPGPFDLRDFCGRMLEEHNEGERLSFQCGEGPFPVVADSLRLRQALENLLSNALKYSDEGVVLSLAAGPERYQMAISDRGIGIPPEERADIFEPFFRASNTGTKPGHGLGLCVVQSCVEQHGGRIHFTSESNLGTTFTLELPLPDPDGLQENDKSHRVPGGSEGLPKPVQRMRSPKDRPLARTDRPLRGLIVDDDPLVRDALRDLLEGSNEVLVVGEAGTVAHARLLARQHAPAVVFLDVHLPDGSGFDLLPDFAQKAEVVFVTSAEEYAVHAFDCEAADYLLKPFTAERLKRALVRVRGRLAEKASPKALPPTGSGDSFLVKTLTEKRSVNVQDIKSILAYGEYSRVFWAKGQNGALLRKSLKQWQSQLPSDQFVRVHRGAIVNLAVVASIEKLAGGGVQLHLREIPEPIPVSFRMAAVLNRKLKEYHC